ncbi:MAG: CbiX/SirB N-terminal domain-containing protein [Bryobacterales bacterium]|nr:CbiX/SirB N-terminal domain-containing protein [Bryobacterales bacterium]
MLENESQPGIVIFAHGSSVESANEAVRLVAAEFARQGGYARVEPAFLENGQPDLAGAVRLLAAQGAREIHVLPYFLTLGIHLQRDLPGMAAGVERDLPGVKLTLAPPLDGHPALAAILLDRARQSLQSSHGAGRHAT